MAGAALRLAGAALKPRQPAACVEYIVLDNHDGELFANA